MIDVVCQSCGHFFRAGDRDAGYPIACPECRTTTPIPNVGAPIPPNPVTPSALVAGWSSLTIGALSLLLLDLPLAMAVLPGFLIRGRTPITPVVGIALGGLARRAGWPAWIGLALNTVSLAIFALVAAIA